MHGHAAGDADADGGDLALRAPGRRVGGQPDAGAPGHAAGGEAELGERVDQRLLQAADVVDDPERLGQPDQRVADELARAVPGDLAAAVDVDDGGAVEGTFVRLGALARGVDGRVLEQQQGVRRLRR